MGSALTEPRVADFNDDGQLDILDKWYNRRTPREHMAKSSRWLHPTFLYGGLGKKMSCHVRSHSFTISQHPPAQFLSVLFVPKENSTGFLCCLNDGGAGHSVAVVDFES